MWQILRKIKISKEKIKNYKVLEIWTTQLNTYIEDWISQLEESILFSIIQIIYVEWFFKI